MEPTSPSEPVEQGKSLSRSQQRELNKSQNSIQISKQECLTRRGKNQLPKPERRTKGENPNKQLENSKHVDAEGEPQKETKELGKDLASQTSSLKRSGS